jgi:hypothetical protein
MRSTNILPSTYSEQRHEKDDVDGDEPVGALRAEQAERAGIVLDPDDERADQRIEEAGDVEDGEEARAVQVFEGIARDHQEAPP